MKTAILLIGFLLGLVTVSFAATHDFTWTANDPTEGITGYRLYMDCGSPECMVKEIRDPAAASTSFVTSDKRNHAFSLTAFREEEDVENPLTESGQSDYAQYVYRPPPVPKPRNFVLKK
jgi:hypothetical protein